MWPMLMLIPALGYSSATGQVLPPDGRTNAAGGWSTSAAPATPAPATTLAPRPQVRVAPSNNAAPTLRPGAVDADAFAAAANQAATSSPAHSADASAPGAAKSGRLRPVIVIDPGHGGVDPGAIAPALAGQPQLLEKNVVLAVSRQLAAVLLAQGRYEVVLTRSGDTFVPLDQRVLKSRQLGADLFISIHADSVAASAKAQGVRGATVYMLSDDASDEQARRLADKENAADQAAGLPATAAMDHDQVRNILVDLMRRETAEFSAEFRSAVVAQLARRIAMAREPQRAAAFKVLKQTEVPAVLIELGYMTNAQDQKLLQSSAWQSQVAVSISASIDAFFSRRSSNALTSGRQ
jgi:N-acetylmuramoyl-L-alanine amidase